jgi:hypothetical protein
MFLAVRVDEQDYVPNREEKYPRKGLIGQLQEAWTRVATRDAECFRV